MIMVPPLARSSGSPQPRPLRADLFGGNRLSRRSLRINQSRPAWATVIYIGSFVPEDIEQDAVGCGQHQIAVAYGRIVDRKLSSMRGAIADFFPGLELIWRYDSALCQLMKPITRANLLHPIDGVK